MKTLLTMIALVGFSASAIAAGNPQNCEANPDQPFCSGTPGPAGPKGDTGEKGDPGVAGKDGVDGKDGLAGIAGNNVDADLGIAVGIAMSSPVWLEPTENFAVSGSWGQYEGESAFAISGIARIQGSLSATGAVGISDDGRKVGSRIGVRYGW